MINNEEKVDGRGASLKAIKLNLQSLRVDRIRSILKDIKGIEFDHITALTEYLSKEFLSKHKENINPSTLRRNKNYRRLIDKYINKKEINDNELIELTENLMIEQSENYQLTQELKTASETISSLLSDLSKSDKAAIESRSHGHVEAFNDTPCRALMKVLDHVGDFDIKRSGVYDEGTLNDPLVFSAEDYPEFFEWYFEEK